MVQKNLLSFEISFGKSRCYRLIFSVPREWFEKVYCSVSVMFFRCCFCNSTKICSPALRVQFDSMGNHLNVCMCYDNRSRSMFFQVQFFTTSRWLCKCSNRMKEWVGGEISESLGKNQVAFVNLIWWKFFGKVYSCGSIFSRVQFKVL